MGIISAGSAAGGRIAEHPALTASIALRAAMVSLLWLLLLVLLMHPTIVAYHPVSDEWALLQHSTASGGEVAGWFRDGFSRYFTSWPGVDTPPMQFLRPVFNAVYLLLGALLGVGSGQYLYVTAAAIAACAGLVYAAGAQRQPATALPLALLLPLLPGFAGSIALLFVPCFMFDALAAAACLGAYLAYQRQRYIWAMVWLALAVLAKETAVPVAAAFVVHAALAWLAAPSPQRLRPVLLLAAPLAAWALLRLAAFHGIVGGVYVSGHNAGVLARMLSHVDQYPYFVDYMAPGSHGKSVRLLGWLNLLLASIGVTLMAARAWRHRKLELAELALLFSYVFLLVLGTSARFGASLDAFLLLSWLHWNREPPSSIWRSLATVGGALLLVGAGLYGWQSAHMYDLYRDDYARMYRLSQRYGEALARLPAGDRVVAFNDPVTRYSPTSAMTAALGLDVRLEKVSDFPWNAQWFSGADACRASFSSDAAGARLTQTCGVELAGALADRTQPLRMQWPGLGTVRVGQQGEGRGWNVVQLDLAPGTRPDWYLWFDPALDDFVVVRAE